MKLRRELTEMRGPDDYEEPDFPGRKTTTARMPTHRELVERPFTDHRAISDRCHCGRPIKDSTGTCLKEH